MTRPAFPDAPLTATEIKRTLRENSLRLGVCPVCGDRLGEAEDISPAGDRVYERYCFSCGWSPSE